MSIKNLAVFVSGGGTNLQAILDESQKMDFGGKVSLVVADNRTCYALERAKKHGIDSYLLEEDSNRDQAYRKLQKYLMDKEIDLIVLAGFLKILPKFFVENFKGKIINLHPSLLPKHGGKDMYGDKVHQAVLKDGDRVSGVTVHYVDAGVDTGQIIAQDFTNVYHGDTIDTLSARIHKIEHVILPRVIRRLIKED